LIPLAAIVLWSVSAVPQTIFTNPSSDDNATEATLGAYSDADSAQAGASDMWPMRVTYRTEGLMYDVLDSTQRESTFEFEAAGWDAWVDRETSNNTQDPLICRAVTEGRLYESHNGDCNGAELDRGPTNGEIILPNPYLKIAVHDGDIGAQRVVAPRHTDSSGHSMQTQPLSEGSLQSLASDLEIDPSRLDGTRNISTSTCEGLGFLTCDRTASQSEATRVTESAYITDLGIQVWSSDVFDGIKLYEFKVTSIDSIDYYEPPAVR
jgi:hypothetical protein